MKRRKLLHNVSKRHIRRLASESAADRSTNSVSCIVTTKDELFLESNENFTENKNLYSSIQISDTCSTFTSCNESASHFDAPSTFNKSVELEKTTFSLSDLSSSSSDVETDPLGMEDISVAPLAIDNSFEIASQSFRPNSLNSDLASWAVQHNVTQSSLTALLKILKHHGHGDLPSDGRTLLSTPRNTILREVQPGLYWHAGLKNAVISLKKLNLNNEFQTAELAINIDGLPLSKSSTSSLWPILVSVIPYNEVFIIGAYHGNTKPIDANDFLKEFVCEVKDLIKSPIIIQSKSINVSIKYFVCDAPAKSFILNIKGHNGYSSCTKCTTEGEYIKNRICFNDLNASKRTDNDFKLKKDEDHHTGVSILEDIPNLGLVSSVPLDYMHLVCLGVMRKLLYLWLGGDLKIRLKSQKVTQVSNLLENLRRWIPKEFVRKPRSLTFLKQWKATEYRQFLLYTGPVVLQETLSKKVYSNFLTLSIAIRILCSNKLKSLYSYADDLLRHFVISFAILYGEHQVSHNVHGLIHLADDAKLFGKLDNFSAFRFENFLQTLKKLIRKSDKPLQQLCRRYIETEKNSSNSNIKPIFPSLLGLNPVSLHFTGPLPDNCSNPQFKKLISSEFVINISSESDNCCQLIDKTVVFVKNIATSSNSNKTVIIVGNAFKIKEDLFDKPCKSSLLNIFKVCELSQETKYWPVTEITSKCVIFPLKNEKYAVFPLLHCENVLLNQDLQ